MRKIYVLGRGCRRSDMLLENTRLAAAQSGLSCDIRRIEDTASIMRFGVGRPPALVVDGRVRIADACPSVEEIKKFLQ